MSETAHSTESPKKIVIMAGGTGGHVFPALAVAQAFRTLGYIVTWMGTREKLEARVIPAEGFEIDFLNIQSLRGKGLLGWALLPWRLWKAYRQALKILKNRQPDLVIGFGGFVSGPGGLASHRLHIPLVLHEQNAAAGLSNRILSRLAKKVYTGFPHPVGLDASKIIMTGNPLRSNLLEAAKTTPSLDVNDNEPLHILVIGGSLGAYALNHLIPQALSQLQPGTYKIWHQSGEKHLQSTQALYQTLNIEAHITPFIEDMANAYHFAHIVICRAGALTLAELAAFGRPAILIPLPTAADNHQLLNARYFSERHAALCCEQHETSPNQLSELISAWLFDRTLLKTMGACSLQLAQPQATESFVKNCQQVIHEK